MTDALNPDLVLQLRVQRASDLAEGIRGFELVEPAGAPLPPFTPGAHVLIQAPNGMTRRYSLCNAPHERERYAIAVKREATGRGGSISMVDALHAGDAVHVSLPRNDFELREGARRYLFIAGGIGITPIRSMIRLLAHRGVDAFRLYYLTRAPAMTAFGAELGGPPWQDNVVIHHDFGDSAQAFDLWPLLEKPGVTHLYCCGPAPLLEAVRDMTGHWPASAVHFEDFAVRKPPREVDDQPFVVRVGVEGPPVQVAADATILQALRAHGYRVPSSCESGTCGTCRMQLVSGAADHRDLVLTDEERAYAIMVCVSRARSAELVLEP